MKRSITLVALFFSLYPIAAIASTSCPRTPSKGTDIRRTALPDPKTSIKSLGVYSEAQRVGMLNTKSNSYWTLWSEVPPIPNSWTRETYALRDRMAQALKPAKTGIDRPLANVIINVCKVYARDPRHCVIYTSAVVCAESSCGQNYDSKKNTIFGVRDNLKPSYVSRTEAVLDWVRRYNTWWYTANEGKFYGFCCFPNPTTGFLPSCDNNDTEFDTKFFYSNVNKKAPMSNYCLSEDGATPPMCPNGYKNSRVAYLNVK